MQTERGGVSETERSEHYSTKENYSWRLYTLFLSEDWALALPGEATKQWIIADLCFVRYFLCRNAVNTSIVCNQSPLTCDQLHIQCLILPSTRVKASLALMWRQSLERSLPSPDLTNEFIDDAVSGQMSQSCGSRYVLRSSPSGLLTHPLFDCRGRMRQ